MPTTHSAKGLACSPYWQQQSTSAQDLLRLIMNGAPQWSLVYAGTHPESLQTKSSSTFGLGCDDEVMLDYLLVLQDRLCLLEADCGYTAFEDLVLLDYMLSTL